MTDPMFIPPASGRDTIHPCAECQFLFRGSSLDAHQKLAASLTGRLLCRVDAYLWWVEERAARARGDGQAVSWWEYWDGAKWKRFE